MLLLVFAGTKSSDNSPKRSLISSGISKPGGGGGGGTAFADNFLVPEISPKISSVASSISMGGNWDVSGFSANVNESFSCSGFRCCAMTFVKLRRSFNSFLTSTGNLAIEPVFGV